MNLSLPKISGKAWAIIAGLLVVATALGLFLVNNSITDRAARDEPRLNAQYLSNQNALSDCVTQIRETANIAGAQAEKFEEVMVETIKGRYDGRTATPGAMFSAITEQYPDLTSLNDAFERVHGVVVRCRADYRKLQDKLLDMLQIYDGWRTGTIWTRTFAKELPSDRLIAQIGNDRSRTGKAALAQMYTIVTTKSTVEAYKTGELVPEQPFGPAGQPTTSVTGSAAPSASPSK